VITALVLKANKKILSVAWSLYFLSSKCWTIGAGVYGSWWERQPNLLRWFL